MKPGDVVAGRFEIERLAGAGGFGAVYRARDLSTGEAVALKELRVLGASWEERFDREARILAELRHPAVVRYVAHGVAEGGGRYLALEWLEGVDLAEHLERRALSPGEAAALVGRVAGALAAVHARGIVHRDVKPQNLFVEGGRIEGVKLLDFGVARIASGPSAATRTGLLIGTPAYMAPEQARGSKALDARADVFALGCVLYECLTREAPFVADNPMAALAKVLLEDPPRVRELRRDVPEALDDLVARMIDKDPARRPRDGAAVEEEIATLGALEVDEEGARPTPAAALTAGEQRMISVVMAGRAAPPGALDPAADPEPPPTWPGALRDPRTRSPEPRGRDPRTRSPEPRGLMEAVAAHGGRLEPLAGGAVVVTLAGPLGAARRAEGATDQAARAARCALELRALLPEVPMAIGTGRGDAAGGRPVGEAIDRAAGLLARGGPPERDAGRAGPAPIRLDDVTAGLLEARFDVGGDAAGLLLRGEHELYEASRTLLGRETPCVGRDRDIAELLALFQECADEPRARAALVLGPAGVGKSRVRYELVRRVRSSGSPVEVWMSRGDPMRAGSPFGMIAPVIRRAAGVREDEPLEVRRQKLLARVGRHVPRDARQRVAEFLGELVGAPFPDEGRVELRAARRDAMLMGDQMRRAWEDFTAAECAAHPVLLVLEDLHWGDLPSVQFLDAALRALADRPLLVLSLARPEVTELFPKLWQERGVMLLPLHPLPRKGSERLVREALGDRAPREVVDRIVAQAEGNAFFLEELIRAEAEGRGAALPETVLAMVEDRIERLQPDARRLLRAASIFGQVFWRGAVTALLGEGGREGGREGSAEPRVTGGLVAAWLAELEEREVIARRDAAKFSGASARQGPPTPGGAGAPAPPEVEYVFRHALVRDAAYAMLTEADRALGHRLAGAWLEAAGESEAVVLAEHFERGGEPARAVGWYRRAAEQALGGDDLEAAIARAERGARCGAAGEVLGALRLVQSEALRWRGENAAALERALEALRLIPPGTQGWFSATTEVALASARLGDTAQLKRIAAELLQRSAVASAAPLAAPLDPDHTLVMPRSTPIPHAPPPASSLAGDVAVTLARAATQLFFAGERDLARAALSRIAEAEARGVALDPTARARILDARATEALCDGDPGACLELSEAAIAHFERAGNLRGACLQRSDVGYAYLEVGAFPEAERALRAALAAAERMSLPYVSAAARSNLGLALARQGALEEAERVELLAVEAFAAQGNLRMEGASRIYLAEIQLLAGRVEDSIRTAGSAVEVLSTTPPARCHALATLARAELHGGALIPALEHARAAHELLEALSGIDEGESLVRLIHAEALAASGDREGARAAIAEARRRLLEKAARVADPRWREQLLHGVPENARTLALAEAWG